MINVASPDEFNSDVPSTNVPSEKVTIPVGVPEAKVETVAVIVTGCPTAEGFEDKATVVDVGVAVVVFACTISFTSAEALFEKLLSPL